MPDRERIRGSRRIFLDVFTLSALVVAVGILLQAFSIAAYLRGAGQGARDLHVTGAYVVHTTEFVVFLAAVIAFWRDWRRVGLAFLLPVLGTIQVFAIGDTETRGGWVNGLHGLLAVVVLLQAAALTADGARALRRGSA